MRLCGKSGLQYMQGPPTRVALLPRDIQLRQSQCGYWGPPVHNMGPCSRPGEDPSAWKQFGPEPTWAISAVPEWVGPVLGRLVSEGFWVADYWWGSVRPPFWRTPV